MKRQKRALEKINKILSQLPTGAGDEILCENPVYRTSHRPEVREGIEGRNGTEEDIFSYDLVAEQEKSAFPSVESLARPSAPLSQSFAVPAPKQHPRKVIKSAPALSREISLAQASSSLPVPKAMDDHMDAVFSFSWLGGKQIATAEGDVHYTSFMLNGHCYQRGDHVVIPDEAGGSSAFWVAKILACWATRDGDAMFEGQWFWQKESAAKVAGREVAKKWPRCRKGEVYYSEHRNVNEIEVIGRPCIVVPKSHIRNQVKRYAAREDCFWFEYQFDSNCLAKVVC